MKAYSESSGLGAMTKAHALKKRLLFIIISLIIYRFGSYIPIPGINSKVLLEISTKNSNGILGMFNMLSGGSLGRMSIFALAIMPYITSSIVFQLLSIVSKNIENLKKEGELGRKKISQYTRYATVVLAAFQGFGVAVSLENMNTYDQLLVINPGLVFRITTTVTLVTGTLFLMWLGEQITEKGIGNGTSLIIFTGIVAGIPSALTNTLELSKAGAVSASLVISVLLFLLFTVALIILMERAQRKITIQYPKRQIGNKIYKGESSHLPLKLNTAGVIPPIFASSLLLFPLTIANFITEKSNSFLEVITLHLAHGKPIYIASYIILISFFCFFYTAVVFNPTETAENLKKNNGFILGRRPGKNTADYLDYVITRITLVGAIYISIVCVLPEILMAHYSVPFYLGGTSILIVVSVIIETTTQIQTHLFTHQYEGLMKKIKLREKRT